MRHADRRIGGVIRIGNAGQSGVVEGVGTTYAAVRRRLDVGVDAVEVVRVAGESGSLRPDLDQVVLVAGVREPGTLAVLVGELVDERLRDQVVLEDSHHRRPDHAVRGRTGQLQVLRDG